MHYLMANVLILLMLLSLYTADNGFNPFWDETFQFHVSRPSLAFLRFTVYDRGTFLFTLIHRNATLIYFL